MDAECVALGGFIRANGNAPGRYGKKHLMKRGRRRSASIVSATSADGPVTVGEAAWGIRRASMCRMIGGSHE